MLGLRAPGRDRIHPGAAARAGIADGDRVRVASPHGAIDLGAQVTADVHPEIAVVPSGFPGANANDLTELARLDPVSGFPALRSLVCRVERI